MRVQVNLPEPVVEQADIKAKQLGLSRSAFISMAICERVRQDTVMDLMPQMLAGLKTMTENEEK